MFEYVPNVHFALASTEMIRQLFFPLRNLGSYSSHGKGISEKCSHTGRNVSRHINFRNMLYFNLINLRKILNVRGAAFHKVLKKPLRNDYSHNSFPVFLAEKCSGNKQFLNS